MPKNLIDTYTHCPICGSKDYIRHEKGRACGHCGHKDFNNPITAVAAFILDHEDRVLLIRRAKDPAAGKLAPPGGFVDAGESLEQAIRREMTEEVGLDLQDVRYLSSHPNDYVYNGLGRPVCDVFFTARAHSFEVVLQAEEANEWHLMPLQEVNASELAFDSMRNALAELRHRRASLGHIGT
jgi:ADP-ribose pyrophosphatase YjhB (NUDIX family)